MSVFRCKCVNWGLFVCRRSAWFLTSSDHRKRKKKPWIPRLPFFLLVSCFFFLLFTLVVQLKFIWKDKTQVNNSKESGLAGLLEKLQHNGFKTSRNTSDGFYGLLLLSFFFFSFRIIKVLLFVCVCVGPKMFLVRECDTLGCLRNRNWWAKRKLWVAVKRRVTSCLCLMPQL